MIISRTPYRISLFGGGTDYPTWYMKYGGAVVATTVDKYLYITCRKLPQFFEHRLRLVYSKIETCNNIDEIEHPSARETLRYLGVSNNVEIHYDGDLPGRSGMGSSSSFTVGLLNALATMEGKSLTNQELAEESIYIEQKMVGERVGSQDQVSAAHGGFNHIRFQTDGSIEVNPIVIAQERKLQLEKSLMLFYTGISRTAANVAESYTADIKDHDPNFKKLHEYVDHALEILKGVGNLDELGSLLHQSWLVKRDLSPKVSNSRIEDAYNSARSAGALGGKITGAGGGGMLLLYVPPTHQVKVKEELSDLLHIPFSLESSGSRIIYPEMSHRSWQVPLLLAENISGFNAIGYDGVVYAIQQSEGTFEPSRVLSQGYSKVFQGPDVETITRLIEQDQSAK